MIFPLLFCVVLVPIQRYRVARYTDNVKLAYSTSHAVVWECGFLRCRHYVPRHAFNSASAYGFPFGEVALFDFQSSCTLFARWLAPCVSHAARMPEVWEGGHVGKCPNVKHSWHLIRYACFRCLSRGIIVNILLTIIWTVYEHMKAWSVLYALAHTRACIYM